MKCTVKTIKIQTTDWKKIMSPNHSSDNGLISSTHIKKSQNSTIKQTNKIIKKKNTKEEIWMANKHAKRCSTSLTITKHK